jgi:DNA-binding NtrC family response regulator
LCRLLGRRRKRPIRDSYRPPTGGGDRPAGKHVVRVGRGAPRFARLLVLVADDEAAVLALARPILERAGFRVVTAVDGREALELYKRHGREIRLVVLDMTMPLLDGEACFLALRELDPDAKIVMTSGFSEQEVVAHFVGKGLAGFVQKPYKADLLLGKIRHILHGSA